MIGRRVNTMKRIVTVWSIVGVLLVASAVISGIILLRGCGTAQPPSTRSPASGGPVPDVGWRKAEMQVAGKTVDIEYRRYDKPVPVTVAPLAELRRDTPVATAMSAMTCIIAGAELDYHWDHFLNPEIQKGLVLSSYSEKQFKESRKKALEGNEIAGEIRVDGHTVVVIVSPAPAGRRYEVGMVLTAKDGKYYIDEKAKREKPIFKQMSMDSWSIITGGDK